MLKQDDHKNNKKIKITINQILDAYANASRNEDISSFWEFIHAANNCGMLPISLNDIEAMIQNNFGIIQNKKYQLETEGHTSLSGKYKRIRIKNK